MLNAQAYRISPNDFLLEEFLLCEPEDPWDEFAWFSVDVGASNLNGQDSFQCLVTTTKARHRAVAGRKDSRCFVVDPFEPQLVLDKLTERINAIEGVEWCNIVDELRTFMHWEYEGMSGLEYRGYPNRPS